MKFWRRKCDSEPRTVEGITVFGQPVVDPPEYRAGEIVADRPDDPADWEPFEVPDDPRGLLAWVREHEGRSLYAAKDSVLARAERLRRDAVEDPVRVPPPGIDRPVTQGNLRAVLAALVRHAGASPATPPADAPPEPAEERLPEPLVEVRVAERRVRVRGIWYPVESPLTLRWVQVLIDRPFEVVRAADLKMYDPELDGAKTKDLREYLPEPLKDAIEAKPGAAGGSRFNPDRLPAE